MFRLTVDHLAIHAQMDSGILWLVPLFASPISPRIQLKSLPQFSRIAAASRQHCQHCSIIALERRRPTECRPVALPTATPHARLSDDGQSGYRRPADKSPIGQFFFVAAAVMSEYLLQPAQSSARIGNLTVRFTAAVLSGPNSAVTARQQTLNIDVDSRVGLSAANKPADNCT